MAVSNYDGKVATTTTAAGTRTIARLWQDAVERHWPGPAYLVQEGEDWREVYLAGAWGSLAVKVSARRLGGTSSSAKPATASTSAGTPSQNRSPSTR